MDRRSAMLIAGGLVIALMAGVVSRELTLSNAPSGPIQIVQSPAVTVPASAPTEERG